MAKRKNNTKKGNTEKVRVIPLGGIGEIAGLGMTLGAVGSVAGMARDAIGPLFGGAARMGQSMGYQVLQAQAPEGQSGWDCGVCGRKGISSNFCPDCGSKRPETPVGWDCPGCGHKNITSNFCPNCGQTKPEPPKGWDCPDCGQKDLTTNFCPTCGRKRG